MIWVYPSKAVPAPRQSRRDTFRPRPPVMRYHALRDELRARKAFCPTPFHHLIFVLQMPSTWNRKQLVANEGMPHLHTPDRDNLEKAFLDSVLENDSHIFDGRVTKLWGTMGLIIVSDRQIDIATPAKLQPFYDWALQEKPNTIRLSHVFDNNWRIAL